MMGGGTVAGLAVGGTDAVSVLRDFESGPVKSGQGGDEAGNDAGLADAAGVSADDQDGHGKAGLRSQVPGFRFQFSVLSSQFSVLSSQFSVLSSPALDALSHISSQTRLSGASWLTAK